MTKTDSRTTQYRDIVTILAKFTTPTLAELVGDQIAEKLGFNADADAPSPKSSEIYERCGGNGAAWAAEFVNTAKQIGAGNIDEGWMIGWFCNAIECAKSVEGSKMREHPIEVGDVVVLRSGGPNMLVRTDIGDSLVCHWIGEDGSLSTESWPRILVVRAARRATCDEDGNWSNVA